MSATGCWFTLPPKLYSHAPDRAKRRTCRRGCQNPSTRPDIRKQRSVRSVLAMASCRSRLVPRKTVNRNCLGEDAHLEPGKVISRIEIHPLPGTCEHPCDSVQAQKSEVGGLAVLLSNDPGRKLPFQIIHCIDRFVIQPHRRCEEAQAARKRASDSAVATTASSSITRTRPQ